jgi:hypothetical protein
MTNPFAPQAPASAPPAAPNPFGPGVATAAPAQQYAPAAPAPAGGDPFGAPAPRADRPTMLCLPGRLLLVMPKRMEYNVPVKNPKPGMPAQQDRLTADVIVLDGGTLHYGGDPGARPPRPHTKTAEVPLRIEGMYISQKGLLSQTREAVDKLQSGQPGAMVLGRLGWGEAKPGENAPYLLMPFTEQDAQVARAWLAANPPTPFTAPGTR